MKELEEKINKEGTVIGTEIVKVDGFLNHQIDIRFLEDIGREIKRIFNDIKVDRILTVESSGIAIACFAAKHFNYVPVVFAKKTLPNTMDSGFYEADSRSFTKGTVSTLRVDKKFIRKGEHVLIIDDFLAHGQAALALCSITEQAGAIVEGVCAVIEKKYQGGSARLREKGYRVEALTSIVKVSEGKVYYE